MGSRHAALWNVLAALAAGAGLTGCAPDAEEPLRVGAAASLREPLERIASGFAEANPGVAVQLVFGASNELAAQLRAGAPLDLLLSADEQIARALEADGLVRDLRPFASNRLAVIASEEVAAQLTQPADLAGPALRRIALPAPAVPVGHYAREWLAQRGLLEAVETRAVQTENARATLAAVEAGHADAAIVYATDARIARSARVAFEVPDAEQPRILYVAAVARETRQPEAAARFLDSLAGAPASEILRDAGFSMPGEPAAP
jgi:molybdate transport system substrate-binding protein